MSDKKNSGSESLRKKLAQVDSEIIRLLAQRSDLFDAHLRDRKSRKQSLSDPEMEKGLWRVWQQESKGLGLNEKLLRRVFHLVNGLAYDRLERPPEKEFILCPRTEPADIDLEGPRDRVRTRMWLALAAASGSQLRMERTVMNDSLFDFFRVLNQTQPRASWEGSSVWIEEGSERMYLDGKSIYVGGDLLNLYILIFLATVRAGSCKFTGDTRVRLADLGPLLELLPKLGTRGVPLLPGNKGLPLRLESSGLADEEIPLPQEAPPELGMALALCAGFFHSEKRGMRLVWSEGSRWRKYLEPVCQILQDCGAEVYFQGSSLRLEPGQRLIPEQPDLPLDPELSSCLLAVPGFVGGRCRLRGAFLEDDQEQECFVRVLRNFGIHLDMDAQAVISSWEQQVQVNVPLDLSKDPESVPLAMALALAASRAELHLPKGENGDFAQELVRTLGVKASLREGQLSIDSGPFPKEEKLEISSPNPGWSMALALVALLRPYLVLQNPGELYGEWPDFWTLYNALPRPQRALTEREEKGKKEDGSKRRRFIVQ